LYVQATDEKDGMSMEAMTKTCNDEMKMHKDTMKKSPMLKDSMSKDTAAK
jgi:hypothetical protein